MKKSIISLFFVFDMLVMVYSTITNISAQEDYTGYVLLVDFKGENRIPLMTDNYGSIKSRWQKQRDNQHNIKLEHNPPIAYVRNTPMEIEVAFCIFPAPPPPEKNPILVWGDGPGNIDFHGVESDPLHPDYPNNFGVYSIESEAPLPQEVGIYDPFIITWKLSLDKGETWISAGQSEHKLYTVFRDPDFDGKYPDWDSDFQSHFPISDIDIGSRNAMNVEFDPNEEQYEELILDNIFDDFRDQRILLTDGSELQYWTGPCAKGETDKDSVDYCYSGQGLIDRQTARCQGIADGFDYILDGQGIPLYPNRIKMVSIDAKVPEDIQADETSLIINPSAKALGNPNPPNHFNAHIISAYGTEQGDDFTIKTIYDPSYGYSFKCGDDNSCLSDWEDKLLQDVCIKSATPPSEDRWTYKNGWYCRPNRPGIEDTELVIDWHNDDMP
jgi:hypothetical protein